NRGMIRRIDLRGRLAAGAAIDYRSLVPRAPLDVEHAMAAVRPICEDVRIRGDAAVLEFAEHFDGIRPPSLRVPEEVLSDALAALDPQVRAALEESITRARRVHED